MDGASGFTLSIVSHGQGALVRDLLHDLRRHGATSLSIVLTLNVPEDESFLADSKDLPVTVIRNAVPKGFGANHNAAFNHCRSRWFAVLNPDLRLPNDPFPVLSRAAAEPGMGIVAPRVVDSSGALEDMFRELPTPWAIARRYLGHKRVIEPSGPVVPGALFHWIAGMFLVFDAEAYRQIGGFDERFFLYCEDYDICARFHRRGYRYSVVREATVVHDARRTSRRSLGYLRWHLSSLLRVWRSGYFWRLVARRSAH